MCWSSSTRTIPAEHSLRQIVKLLTFLWPVRQEDETLIDQFGTYIGLALHHAKLYDKIRKAESNVQVGTELCAYYAQAKQAEVDEILGEGEPREEDHEDIRTQM